MTTPPTAPSSESLDTLLVLVVDDMEDNRELYQMGLSRGGCRVDVARDGRAALVRIASERPAVIVMDLDMPVMDGWEATRQVKTSPGTKDIIVIVVTGTATDRDLERAWAAGADEVCTKPCTPASLLGHVRRLVAARGAAPASGRGSGPSVAGPPSPR